MLALFVACLCHDIDHRGTTNSFQVSSVSEISGSVLLCAIRFKLKMCLFAFCFVWFAFFFCLLLNCVRLFYCFQGSTLAALYSSKGSVLEVRAVLLLLLLLLMIMFFCSCFFFSFFSYAHQEFQNYAMVQFGVIDLKSHTLSRA